MTTATKIRGDMTRAGIQEYTEAVWWRHLKATKKEKGRILDEFIRVGGYYPPSRFSEGSQTSEHWLCHRHSATRSPFIGADWA